MARRMITGVTVVLCMSVAASACGGGGSNLSSVNPDLKLAIRFLPTGADASYMFQFADWGRVEQELGYSGASLASAHADQLFSDKLERLSGGSPGGNTTFDLQSAGVGNVWSIHDVLWDAEEFPIRVGAPLAITAFRDDSVISRTEKHLAKCGFRSRSVGGMTLYTAIGSAALNCLSPIGTGIPGPFNDFAFDAADRLALQSASATAVMAAIADRRHGGSNPPLDGILSRLGAATQQVAVATGPQSCSELSNPAFLAGREASPSTVLRAGRVFSDTTAYVGFGFGYQYIPGGVSGRLVFVYPTGAVARADLNRRERMLRNGIAFSASEPYSQLFLVRSGRTQGPATIYQVGQPGQSALRLGTAFDQDDIGFARC
jgi:hypothetical protein